MTRVSLRLNLIANSAGQIYSALLGILMLPVFYSESVLGAESVGLIGFYTMLMFWFNLLDLGITPTLSRETTRFLTNASSADFFYSLLAPLLVFFAVVSLLAGAAVIFNAENIAAHWLKPVKFTATELTEIVQLIAVVLVLRWNSGLMRGIVTGAEQLLWLNIVNALIMSLRFLLVLPIMAIFGFSIWVFFVVQFIAAVLEFCLLAAKSYQLVYQNPPLWQFGWQPLQTTFKFAISVALLSTVGVTLSQLDKLALSSMLPLHTYGDITIAATVASGLLMLGSMFSGAVLPRLTALYCVDDFSAHTGLYRRLTQWLLVVAGSSCLVVASASEPLLYSWIGKADISPLMLSLLPWYCLGNLLLLLNGLAYYLQYARGELKYHIRMQLVVVMLWIGLLFWTLTWYDAVAAAIAWCVLQFVVFLLYLPFIHKMFLPGLHRQWLLNDVLKILLPMILVNIVMQYIQPAHDSRLLSFVYVAFVWLLTVGVAALFSSDLRPRLLGVLSSRYG